MCHTDGYGRVQTKQSYNAADQGDQKREASHSRREGRGENPPGKAPKLIEWVQEGREHDPYATFLH